jgi:phosphatidylinositol 4-kinase
MRQAAVSTLYALLNEITRYSDEESADQANPKSIVGAPPADVLTDSQKQQVVVNVLSAIVNVAVYLADESVSK